jgi:hypothetical protein
MKTNKYYVMSLAVAVLVMLLTTIGSNLAMAQTSNEGNKVDDLAQGSINAQAQRVAPQITSVTVIQSGDNPLIEVKGSGFGKNANQVKVMLNDNGLLITPQQVKNKRLVVQLPNASLCSGQVRLRVIADTTSSNNATFSYQKSAPIIYTLTPEHAKAGSVVEIKADNLACDVANNLVTVNDSPVAILGINMGKLTIRIPETFSAGKARVRLSVGSQASLAKDFTIDTNSASGSMGGNSGSDNKLVFLSSSPAGATFAPMFNIRDAVTVNNVKTGLWDAMFYGTHQTIIDLPWKAEGVTQKALLTINVREVNNVYGNFTGQKERFIYTLIQFPKNPEKIYHPDNNPFFWGACSVSTESSPSGGFIFNSLGRATGGIDSFDFAKDGLSNGKATMTMRLVAPDLGYYEDYGINYSKAGTTETRLPKLITLTVEMQDIQPSTPSSQFRIGKVIFNDEVTGKGIKVTENLTFANTISITDVVDLFGLGTFR